MKDFYMIESCGVNNEENKRVIENFTSEIKFVNDRYDVKLPFKENHSVIEDNYNISKQRLKNLCKKLTEDKNLLTEYDNIIQDQLKNNIIEKVTPESYDVGKTTYLPHRPVVKKDRSTSKVRVVFDASTRNQGPSLNQCLYPGPSLTTSLFSVLLRFRSYNYAVVADIKQAFLQINLNEQHRNYVRFLWFTDISKINFENFENCELQEYRFCRVIFGVTSSPFLLTATIKYHFTQYEAESLIEKILKSLHVDDFTGGADTQEESYNLFRECKEKLADGGFMLRKFQSNSNELEELVYSNHPETKPESIPEQNKVLGIMWYKNEDYIAFDIQSFVKNFNPVPTKRRVLHALASLFDPMGLLNPVIVKLKILFQDLCISNVDWDEELDDQFKSIWHSIIDDLSAVKSIKVERKYCIRDIDDPFTSIQIHTFCDASKRAHGACLYLRFVKKSGFIRVCLVTAKSNVNPIVKNMGKSNSIPKLELRGAVLAAKLTENVLNELKVNYNVDQVLLWTDSTCVYSWILNTGNLYERFIQTRLEIIRKLLPNGTWKLVPSKLNPADIISKGCGIQLLNNNYKKLWFHGSSFLSQPAENWPEVKPGDKFDSVSVTKLCTESIIPCLSAGISSETNKVPCLSVGTNLSESMSENITVPCLSAGTDHFSEKETPSLSNVIKVEKFSSLNKLLRVSAFVMKFITNLKSALRQKEELNNKYGNVLDNSGLALTANELNLVKIKWLKEVQMNIVNKGNYKQLCKSLNLYFDDNDLIRSRGRLENAPGVTFNVNNPILLPKRHYFTELVILDSHKNVGHGLVKSTLNNIRNLYWIPQARTYIRKILKRCYLCKLHEGQSYSYPPMPPLPKNRVIFDPAFTHIGIDYTGPIFVKNVFIEKDNSLYKVWIALITCSSSRAIYLDVSSDYSAPECVNVLQRFYNRRGVPRDIQSDNGTNFTSAEVQDFVANRNSNWSFNTPSAPWTGGFFERLIKSTKRVLYKLLGKRKVKYDELLTLLSQIENIINNRPLTYQYEESDDTTITPNHLLFGRSLNTFWFGEEENENIHVDKRSRYLKTILQQFWKRWNDEYLKELREHTRYTKQVDKPIIKENDVCLIEENKIRRNNWKIGIVTEINKSKDGNIRSAVVKTLSDTGKPSLLTRPVNKLYPLEQSCENVNDKQSANTDIKFIDDSNVPIVKTFGECD